jgi:hypothetical protein
MDSPWGGSSTLRCGDARTANYSAIFRQFRGLSATHSEKERTTEFRIILYILAQLAEFFI